jgi:hypothetical protein
MDEVTPSSRRDKSKLASVLKYPPPKAEDIARTTRMSAGPLPRDANDSGTRNLEGKSRLQPASLQGSELQTSTLSMEPHQTSRNSRSRSASESNPTPLAPATLELGE